MKKHIKEQIQIQPLLALNLKASKGRCNPCAENHHNNAQKQAGSVLIEALVAIVIIGMGAIGLIGIQNTAMRGVISSHYQTQAALAAEFIIEAIHSNPANIEAYLSTTTDIGNQPDPYCHVSNDKALPKTAYMAVQKPYEDCKPQYGYKSFKMEELTTDKLNATGGNEDKIFYDVFRPGYGHKTRHTSSASLKENYYRYCLEAEGGVWIRNTNPPDETVPKPTYVAWSWTNSSAYSPGWQLSSSTTGKCTHLRCKPRCPGSDPNGNLDNYCGNSTSYYTVSRCGSSGGTPDCTLGHYTKPDQFCQGLVQRNAWGGVSDKDKNWMHEVYNLNGTTRAVGKEILHPNKHGIRQRNRDDDYSTTTNLRNTNSYAVERQLEPTYDHGNITHRGWDEETKFPPKEVLSCQSKSKHVGATIEIAMHDMSHGDDTHLSETATFNITNQGYLARSDVIPSYSAANGSTTLGKDADPILAIGGNDNAKFGSACVTDSVYGARIEFPDVCSYYTSFEEGQPVGDLKTCDSLFPGFIQPLPSNLSLGCGGGGDQPACPTANQSCDDGNYYWTLDKIVVPGDEGFCTPLQIPAVELYDWRMRLADNGHDGFGIPGGVGLICRTSKDKINKGTPSAPECTGSGIAVVKIWYTDGRASAAGGDQDPNKKLLSLPFQIN